MKLAAEDGGGPAGVVDGPSWKWNRLDLDREERSGVEGGVSSLGTSNRFGIVGCRAVAE